MRKESIALICVLLSWGCSNAAEPLELTTEHFRVAGDTATSDRDEMQQLSERAELLYDAVAAIISPAIEPTGFIEVSLNGDYSGIGPHVDQDGTIQLYRYSADEGGYGTLLAHELVHAMAFEYGQSLGAVDWPDLPFYDEAWAEYLAQEVDPNKGGFPFYRFDEDIVVGYWVDRGGLSLAQLRASHFELNERCNHQAYPMRASWFRYVDETYGRQAALDVIYPDDNPTVTLVAGVLGDDVAAVDAAWAAWATARYAAIDDADTQAEAYQARIDFYEPCEL